VDLKMAEVRVAFAFKNVPFISFLRQAVMSSTDMLWLLAAAS
jgi:hypothetical protein